MYFQLIQGSISSLALSLDNHSDSEVLSVYEDYSGFSTLTQANGKQFSEC